MAGTTSYQTLEKSWWASCHHWKVALEDLFGRVNKIGLWTWYGTPLSECIKKISPWEQWLALTEYVKEVVLVKGVD